MNTAYASFSQPDKTEKLNRDDQLAFEGLCEQAGFIYASEGNEKLPLMAKVDGRQFPVVRSRLLEAKAFSRGWKDYWHKELGCLPAECKRRQRRAKKAAKAAA